MRPNSGSDFVSSKAITVVDYSGHGEVERVPHGALTAHSRSTSPLFPESTANFNVVGGGVTQLPLLVPQHTYDPECECVFGEREG